MIEVFNNEELISSLIIAGYNKVDILLYKLVLDKIREDEKINKQLAFKNTNLISSTFSWYITYEDLTYSLHRKELTDAISYEKGNFDILVGDVLPANKKLIKYLLDTDLKDIIIKKAKLIGTENLHLHSESFSNKEINILKEEFGIEVFGEVYSYIDKLPVNDYRNMTDEEVIEHMKNFKYTNFIYKYCLSDHQREIADKVLLENGIIPNLENHSNDEYSDILEEYKNKETDSSVLINVCSAYSRMKR